MSETDDTDELLLIPPDLFVIDSDFEQPYITTPYYKIVDTLITQVSHLEDRLNYITIGSESTLNSSIDYVDEYPLQMSKERNYYSTENLASTQSTPQKPRSIFKLNSLPPSPNTQRHAGQNTRQFVSPNRKYANRRSPSNKDNVRAEDTVDSQSEKMKLLNEIDNFITNVKTKTKTTTARNLERDYKSNDNRSLEMKEVNAFLEDMESRLANGNMHQNLNMLTATSASDMMPSTAQSLLSVETLGSSSGSSQITAYHNGNPNVQESHLHRDVHCDVSANNSDPRRYYSNDEMLRIQQNEMTRLHSAEINAKSDADTRLLSLTDLWGQYAMNGGKNIVNKLEEERLRRKHCEDLIQDLQQKILELQERLAVAIEVDQNKDAAILRFHEAWNKVAVRLESLKKDKIYLERDLQELQSKSAYDLAEAAKKIAYYETEASKALNLAHGSHEKVTALESQNAQTIMEIDNLQKERDIIQMEYAKLDTKNKQLNELIAQKELAIKEKEIAVSDALKEVGEGRRTVEICQAEFITMKTQYTQLELDFNDAKDRIRDLEKQQKKLLGDVESYKRIERDLKEEQQKAKDTTDKTKHELRNFYQNQVEVVVRDKLKEFQEELENAEKAMQNEIKNRELNVAKTAAQHIQNLEEKHTIEVQLLEEKHLEEIRLYSAKLGQSNQRIDNLESKLQEQSHRRDKIAHQLHKIMEVQWREALKLINSKTPSSPDIYNEQLNQLKSKSYSNLEELLSGKESPTYEKGDAKELVQAIDVTPVSSKPRSRQQIESELQKYVQMLLPKSISAPDTNQNKGTQFNNDKSNWHQELLQDEYNKPGKSGISRRLMKPPWK